MVVCDKWVAVKVLEVIFCISCIVCKRVTDDESIRVSLYLQKLSREWSLLRNITWTSIGASFGDAVYGGYVIITFGLLLGRIFREVPRGRRILEGFLLGIGALFFIVLGALELASLDSIPDNLIDNAAVLGVLSLVTAVLFLIDLAGPRGRSTSKHSQTEKQDAEKISFGYPTLPRENKDEPKTDKTDKNSLQKPKFFPEKFKKVYKREQADKILENEENIKTIQNDTRDDVDTFIQSQSNGYHKFNDKQPDEDSSFEKMEKSKYGSVRNGNSRLFMETEPIQKIPSRQSSKQLEKYLKNTDTPTFSSKQYEEEMVKNMSYLKLLDEKHKAAKRTEDKFYEPESSKGHQIHKDYKRNISQQTGSPILVEREKQRHWETFDEESLPPFSVKEDYLPELQTPVFARIKENKQQKSYNIYDNYSNYVSSNGKKEENSQTDSLRSKTSTLKTKPPTLQQIAEYFGLEQKKWPKTEKREAASQVDKDELPVVSFLLPMSAIRETKESGDYRNEPTSPTDPGYVQYTAQNWNERLNRNYSPRTPRHSPTD